MAGKAWRGSERIGRPRRRMARQDRHGSDGIGMAGEARTGNALNGVAGLGTAGKETT